MIALEHLKLQAFNNHLDVIDGLTLAVASTEPIVGLCEVRIKYFLKYQVDTLADHSIHHYGYAYPAGAFAGGCHCHRILLG
jgi:hypothetical protein